MQVQTAVTDSNGILKRDDAGKFAPGTKPGPGRPPGRPNKTTADLRVIRHRIAESWDRVGGDRLLDKLALDRPLEYLRLVFSLLPRQHILADEADERRVLQVIIAKDEPPPNARRESSRASSDGSNRCLRLSSR